MGVIDSLIGFVAVLSGLAFLLLPVWIVWVVMHYKWKQRKSTGLSEEETRQLEELMAASEHMAERIKTLELILDAENPEWRDFHGQK